ncbi:MAG: cob(I)yrinic acid a,c-diamide adenosyltransferase [Patescibacteria group bacterium]
MTKIGDKGKSYWMGREEDKDGDLLEAIGVADELKAVMGLVRLEAEKNKEVKAGIKDIEDDLWGIMGELSCGIKYRDCGCRIIQLEEAIEKMEKETVPIRKFIGFECRLGALLNWARTVARRVERRLVRFSRNREVREDVLTYFNRLSDYLFMLGRKSEEQ